MKPFYFVILLLLIYSCSNSNSENTNLETIDTISTDLTGALNLFPLALNPDFTSVSKVNLADGALVGIVNFSSEIRVYPYSFIVHNEVVNDEFQGVKYAISYCPITKSSLAFSRSETFRASGYLYKDNLAPWDEKTESIWSQMLIKAIQGEKSNTRFNTIPVVETTWKTVKEYFPNAKVVSSEIFSSKEEPSGGDSTNSENAPSSNELVYGILDDFNNIRIFKYSNFSNDSTINLTIQGQKYIVYGNSSKHIINAFKVENFEDYTVIEDEFPFVLKQINGIKYDVLGRGTNGVSLEKPKYAYVAIWSAWLEFYDNFTFQ
ncbi:MAG: DUF3179 domain-containing (seleno)protein [Lutibacter sp.]|uniref:DUF3179 domain-containing (seleno)protein n=1 Tax=Lutibacter sp. TaxID=1925666 RepID=UPI00385CE64F